MNSGSTASAKTLLLGQKKTIRVKPYLLALDLWLTSSMGATCRRGGLGRCRQGLSPAARSETMVVQLSGESLNLSKASTHISKKTMGLRYVFIFCVCPSFLTDQLSTHVGNLCDGDTINTYTAPGVGARQK